MHGPSCSRAWLYYRLLLPKVVFKEKLIKNYLLKCNQCKGYPTYEFCKN